MFSFFLTEITNLSPSNNHKKQFFEYASVVYIYLTKNLILCLKFVLNVNN